MPKISMSVPQEALAKLGIDHRKAASLLKEQLLKLSETIGRISYNENVLLKLSQKLINDISPLESRIRKGKYKDINMVELTRITTDMEILYEVIKGYALTPIEQNVLKHLGYEIKILKTMLDKNYNALLEFERVSGTLRNKAIKDSLSSMKELVIQDTILEIIKTASLLLAYVTGLYQLLQTLKESLKTASESQSKMFDELINRLEKYSESEKNNKPGIYQ